MAKLNEQQTLVTHSGGCHCGAVRFEVQAPQDLELLECSCSRCNQLGFLHLIVPASRFRLLTDDSALTEYLFNTGVARHLFCSCCGIQSFYVPRSNPDGYSVNGRCLDMSTVGEVSYGRFDGANWESEQSLSHLSAQ